MFSLVTGIYNEYFAAPQLNILMVGAQSVGKTTILERMKVTSVSAKLPHSKHRHSGTLPDAVSIPPSVFFLNQQQDDEEDFSGDHSIDSRWVTPHKALPGTLVAQRKRRLWICPAPEKYTQAASDDEVVLVSPQPSNSNTIASSMESTDINNIDSNGEHQQIPSDSNGEHQQIPSENVAARVWESPSQELPATIEQRKRRMWICPAPEKYAQAAEKEDEDDESQSLLAPIQTPLRPHTNTRTSSMESIDLNNSERNNTGSSRISSHNQIVSIADSTAQQPHQVSLQHDFDLKPGAKMLPLHKIRPTMGMNLAKLQLLGAVCHVWDVGGRLVDLWERYYADADAVIFVWKIRENDDDDLKQDASSSAREDDDDDPPPVITPGRQLELLQQVRSSVPDDVPFLILAHYWTDNCNRMPSDQLYSTACLLPHYHNPHQGIFFVNARTGQGIKSAIEWLMPLAKRQFKMRDRRIAEDDDLRK